MHEQVDERVQIEKATTEKLIYWRMMKVIIQGSAEIERKLCRRNLMTLQISRVCSKLKSQQHPQQR